MTVSLDNYTFLIRNDLSKTQNLEDWSLVIQHPKSNTSVLRIPARKHAVTIAGYSSQKKSLFAFNITFCSQIQESGVTISQKINDYIEAKSLTKLWKILPYKSQWESAFFSVDNWLSSTFPGMSVECIELRKGDCFLIDRKKGSQKQEHKPEFFVKNCFRQLKKASSLVACQEGKIKMLF